MTIREDILLGVQDNSLVSCLDTISRSGVTDKENLAAELTSLDNNGEIGLADALIAGDTKALEYHHLYRIKEMLGCVISLHQGTVQDVMGLLGSCLSIGQQSSGEALLPAFEEWLSARPKELKNALNLLDHADIDSIDIYACVIRIAISTDHKKYFNAILKLIRGKNVNLATVTLRTLAADNEHLSRASADKILKIIKKPNPNRNVEIFSAGIIFSITEMAKARKVKHNDYFPILVDALSIEGTNIIGACTQALSRNPTRLPHKVATLLIQRIDTITLSEGKNLNGVGWALSRLLKTKHSHLAIQSVEKLMNRNDIDNTEIVFQEMDHYLSTEHVEKLEELFVRWFLNGNYKHCNSLFTSVQRIHGSPPEYKFSSGELAKLSEDELLFICRKAIGFLFHFPVTAASLLVSALNGQTKQTRSKIEDLLYYPIMISNSVSVGDFLKRVKKGKSRAAQYSIRNVIKRHDNYLAGLKSVGEISEFHLSAQERSIVLNKDNDTFEEASAKPENRSALLDAIATKQILLHGSGSISYHKDLGADKTYRRFATKLQSHSFSYELPRLASIDAPGLQFMLWRFKTEQLT